MTKEKDNNDDKNQKDDQPSKGFMAILIYALRIFSGNLDYLNFIENTEVCFYIKGAYILLNGRSLSFANTLLLYNKCKC